MTGFPSHILKPQQKVLCLFAAAFGGRQDVRFIHDAGVRHCTMVDINSSNLNRMEYPYAKVCADCFEVIDKMAKEGRAFDVITSDHWTGQDADIHGKYFEKICAIAPIRILGISQTYLNSLPSRPAGEYYKRSDFNGGIFWRLI